MRGKLTVGALSIGRQTSLFFLCGGVEPVGHGKQQDDTEGGAEGHIFDKRQGYVLFGEDNDGYCYDDAHKGLAGD